MSDQGDRTPNGDASGGAMPTLTAEELQRFCEFLYRRTGIAYGENKRFYIERRIADRMQALGTTSFTTYMTVVRAGGPEAEHLINSFTVNETYYYREDITAKLHSDHRALSHRQRRCYRCFERFGSDTDRIRAGYFDSRLYCQSFGNFDDGTKLKKLIPNLSYL
jgi:hypothetical protein